MAITLKSTTEYDAQLGLDCELWSRLFGLQTPPAFVKIGAIESIAAPKIAVSKIESKRLGTHRKVYKPTRTDSTMTFGVQHIPFDTNVGGILAELNTGTIPIREWKIVYPSGHTEIVPGFIESYDPGEVDADGIMVSKIGVQLTGPSVYADPTT